MVTCANCSNGATYTYTIVDGFALNYCDKHLPTFARKRGLATPIAPKIEVAEPKAVAPEVPKPESVAKPLKKSAVIEEASTGV